MVDLAPVMIQKTENAGSSESQVEGGNGTFEAATFATDRVKNLARNVQRIVEKFHSNTSGSEEELFVDTANLRPTAFDAADRIIHGDIVEGRPILAHEDNVLSIKGTIKLRECMTRMGEIAKILVTGDGIECSGESR